jgi:hypothetical protein
LWEAPSKFFSSYLLEMIIHILLNVLDGIKSFHFSFIFNFGKGKMSARAKSLNGEGVWSQKPLFVKEILEQLTWCVQVHCHATETSSCFHENLVWPVEFFATVIPSLLNSIGHLWFFLLQQVPWECFLLNQITLLFRHTVYVSTHVHECVCEYFCSRTCVGLLIWVKHALCNASLPVRHF